MKTSVRLASTHRIRRRWFDWRKRRWQTRHNPQRLSRPAFLVGCQRSGTNLIARRLNLAPEVELYNENNPKAFHNYRLHEPRIIAQLIEQSSAPVVLFKPLVDTHRTDVLLRHFPDARVLFAFRHFEPVVASMVRTFDAASARRVESWVDMDFAPFVASAPSVEMRDQVRRLFQRTLNVESCWALYWYVQNRFYFDRKLARDARVLLLQYEALVNSPEREFRKCCEHLGITFTPKMTRNTFPTRKLAAPLPIEPQIRTVCEELWNALSRWL